MTGIALPPIIQSGSKFDFVHLSETTNGVNRALKKNGGDFNHLVLFGGPLKKSQAVPDTMQPVGISIALTMGSSIAFVIHSVDRSFDPALALWCEVP